MLGDAVSRLLGLHDLLTNSENFGFFRHESDPFIFRIIDFRVKDDEPPQEESERRAIAESNFQQFLAGNPQRPPELTPLRPLKVSHSITPSNNY